mmetsp:Transcript_23542/g.39443  ORF Transcript_23542/g.39443 Transcript_23542/m.39443 type:complete len:166 (+) Transcript_23542:552-1049(+)
MLDATLLNEATPAQKYAIVYNHRNNNEMHREEVVKEVASIIGPKHKVDLRSPDSVILIEVFKSTCAMSVVTEYYDLERFNIRTLIHGKPPQNPPGSGKKKTEGTGGDKSVNRDSKIGTADVDDKEKAKENVSEESKDVSSFDESRKADSNSDVESRREKEPSEES